MRRRAADPDRHTFELVEDLDVGTAPAGEGSVGATPGTTDPPAGRLDPATRRRRRRVVVAGAAAAALVLAGMVAVDVVSSRADRARLADAAGGVFSTAHEPRVAWERDIDLSTDSFSFGTGALVLSEGDVVVGYDLESGTESWRRTFGGPTTCGSGVLRYSSAPADPEGRLVCLPGAPVVGASGDGGTEGSSAGAVTILAADGSPIHERAFDEAAGPGATGGDVGGLADVRWLRAVPGPRGSLLWTGRVGPEPELQGTEVLLEAEASGVGAQGEPGDAVVAVQDVASGDLRWHETVAADRDPEDPYSCVSFDTESWEGGAPETGSLDLDQVTAYGGVGVVVVQGCGVTATFSEDGVRLDAPDDPIDGAALVGGRLVRDPSGGPALGGWTGLHGMSGGPLRSAVLAADGSVDWEAPGILLPPAATDGRSRLWFSTTDDGLVALDESGRQEWVADVVGMPDEVLVATKDTVVVATMAGLAGLDARSGTERWTLERADDEDAPAPHTVTQAFTDGRVALLQVDTGTGGRQVGVGLADGRVVWTSDASEHQLLAVQGHLVRLGEHSLAVMG
nr:PQQ-binding-like beta-propeller repeat protein [Cellulosimicrobium arenosum]